MHTSNIISPREAFPNLFCIRYFTHRNHLKSVTVTECLDLFNWSKTCLFVELHKHNFSSFFFPYFYSSLFLMLTLLSPRNIPPACSLREPSFNNGAAALFSIFLIEEATNSGMCSTPTAQPCGPTISAKQAVKYPVPKI